MSEIPGPNYGAMRLTRAALVMGLLLVVVLLAAIFAFSAWMYVPQGHFVVLMQKTGTDLPNDMLMAGSPEFKGVQLEVVKEGYHLYNPYTWWWTDPQPATVIPEMQVGILTRRYGKPLAPGQVLADKADEKGVLREPIMPGRHYLNSYAYNVDLAPMVHIEPGFVGVVTLLVGKEAENPNVFVVKEGERGTQPFLLPAGTHPQYSNKWMYKVVPIDIRSQKLEMMGETAVDFLSEDGFPIHSEFTIEYALDQKKLAEMFVMFVDDKENDSSNALKNIEAKLIVPFGRSLYRIYGAQHKAVDYLIGSTRIVVQNQVESELRSTCAKQGILIRSFVIRSTDPPQKIRQQYERRELAKRQREQFMAEIVTEIGYPATDGGVLHLTPDGLPTFDKGVPVVDGGKPKLDKNGAPVYEGGRLSKELQTRMKDRADQIGEVRLEIASVTRNAEQYSTVELTRASQRVEVAKLTLEAAGDTAAQKVAGGEAQAAVIKLKNKAEVAGIEATVNAFGSGEKYAQYLLSLRFAPAVKSIWSNTDGFFTDVFRNLTAPGKGDGATTPPLKARADGGQR